MNALKVALISGESLLSVALGPSPVPCTPMISAAGQFVDPASAIAVAGTAAAGTAVAGITPSHAPSRHQGD